MNRLGRFLAGRIQWRAYGQGRVRIEDVEASNVKEFKDFPDFFRPSMSQGTVMLHNRLQEKDFTVATPEEFVKRFNGTKVINKVNIFFIRRYRLKNRLIRLCR